MSKINIIEEGTAYWGAGYYVVVELEYKVTCLKGEKGKKYKATAKIKITKKCRRRK